MATLVTLPPLAAPAETPAPTPTATAPPHAPALPVGNRSPILTSIGLELVYIPPGEVAMGSTEDEKSWAMSNGIGRGYADREGSQMKRTVPQGFWLGRTEVTVGQWKRFVEATRYETVREKLDAVNWRSPKRGVAVTDSQPVTCINWKDAVAFCDWLNGRELRPGISSPVPAGYRMRLPTEIEWEYACRAGTQTKFWWGESKEDGQGRLNWAASKDGFKFVAPVDRFGARGRNKFGLADMLGNVAELCLDKFESRLREPPVVETDSSHSLRGGAYNTSLGAARCAYRSIQDQGAALDSHGFRVACAVPVPATGR